MRFNTIPADFAVEEILRAELLPRGTHAVYRVRKHNATTLQVQAQMARSLHVSRSRVVFPALKDKRAVATQHATVPAGAPERVAGHGFEAHVVGYLNRPLGPTNISANRFSIVVRDLDAVEATLIKEGLAGARETGLPNYFDRQRFGSLSRGHDHIAKRILLRDAEGALRAYLTHPFAGDPAHVRRFKAAAAEMWGDWPAMFEAAPRPSNFRSVLTYLRDHPPADAESPSTIYRKGLNLINRRLLSIYLTAYQSLLWNRIAGRDLIRQAGPAARLVEVAGDELPLFNGWPDSFDRSQTIALPHHRAQYRSRDTEAIAARVLGDAGLRQDQLKPRILTKAYLPRGERPLLVFPQEGSSGEVEPDEMHEGRGKLAVRFVLQRGAYATMVIRALVGTPTGPVP